MEINDIQRINQDQIELTFANDDGEDALRIYLSKRDIHQIVDFFKEKMSLLSQKKRK